MCPHTSQWNLRSRSLCNTSEPEYTCLFDDNEKVYKEFCKKDSDTQRPGINIHVYSIDSDPQFRR